MKKKINVRLIGIALIAILVTLLGVTSIYYYVFQNQVQKDLHVLAHTLVDSDVFQKERIEKFSFESDEIRVTWIDEDGTVLYDSWLDASQMENHLERPEIKAAIENGKGDSVRTSDTLDINTYYYAVAMNDGTIARVAINASSGMSIFLSAMPMVVLIAGLIILICVLIADFLTKQLVNPIAAIARNLDESEMGMPNNQVYKELEPFVQTIRAQHENILAAAKMRQDFTANVSHELKTPLTAISGYAELMENNMVSPEQSVKFSGEIRKNSERLLKLINEIIRLSELDHTEEQIGFETMDLYTLAYECAEELKVNAARRGIEFTLEGSCCIIRGNKDMLHELIQNLCENAIRYNNEGGTVKVFVGEKDGRQMLSVKDNGIGIPLEHQDRIFERFYRVDKSRSKATGGTGLGLAIVKHIVAIHEANILLESEVGKGTTISVVF